MKNITVLLASKMNINDFMLRLDFFDDTKEYN